LNISIEKNNAAGQIVELLAKRFGKNRAIHPETAIAVAARLSGSFLLRSFNFKLDTFDRGAIILSEEANEKGQELLGILSASLASKGGTLDGEKLGGEKSLRGEEPHTSFDESIALLQNDVLLIAQENKLGFEEIAQAAILATAFIIGECTKTIGAETAFNVAVYALIEGSKTVPPPFTCTSNVKESKPWYKVW
jgi:hypothetical protein